MLQIGRRKRAFLCGPLLDKPVPNQGCTGPARFELVIRSVNNLKAAIGRPIGPYNIVN